MDNTLTIHIIYASTGGNTEHVMEQVAKYWQEKGVQIVLHRAEQTPISIINDNKYFLLSTSTWDHGTINPFFNKLLAEMKTTDITGKVASFIGLGDRRYEKHYFCTGMTLLKEVWEKQNGTSVGVALTIGREPFMAVIEKMVQEWAEATLSLYQPTNTNQQAVEISQSVNTTPTIQTQTKPSVNTQPAPTTLTTPVISTEQTTQPQPQTQPPREKAS